MRCPNCGSEQAPLYECEDLFLCNECLYLLDKTTGELFRMKEMEENGYDESRD